MFAVRLLYHVSTYAVIEGNLVYIITNVKWEYNPQRRFRTKKTMNNEFNKRQIIYFTIIFIDTEVVCRSWCYTWVHGIYSLLADPNGTNFTENFFSIFT